MSIFLVFTFFCLFFAVVRVQTDDCKPTRCRRHGPTIRFPFRNQNRSPQHCGYPGFDVFCNERRDTVLQLPLSVQVVIKKIDYPLQQVDLYDPEKCLIKKLSHLNLSTPPLQFLTSQYTSYMLVNCSGASRRVPYSVPCLDGSGSLLLAIPEGIDIGSLEMTYCTRIHNGSVPWPTTILENNDLRVRWSEPVCGGCEANGKRCSLLSNASDRTSNPVCGQTT